MEERQTNSSFCCPVTDIFVMIGAEPNSGWLKGTLDLSDKGFVKSGSLVGSPFRFGTTLEGVFAVGDVREGSTKRVASAVGEGASVVGEIHEYLQSLSDPLAWSNTSPSLEPAVCPTI